MSDRASGLPGHTRLGVRAALLLGFLAIVAGPAAPLAAAAGGLAVTTQFPAVVAEPGSTTSFKLAFDTASSGRVSLKAAGAPDGWVTRFRGGGSTIDGAYVTPAAKPDVTLDVEVPQGTPAGTTTVIVTAIGDWGATATLPLTIRVADAAAGNVTLTSDFPELKGPSSSTFTFNLTLKNETATDSTFAIDAAGPDGWTVTAKPAGQAQATSIVVAAGGTGSIAVTALAPSGVAAASYPIKVAVNGSGKVATVNLAVTITGTYQISVSTPNQVLSTTANAGSATPFQILITNGGTAAVTQVTPSAKAPTGWKVAFEPATVASIDAGQSATVTAQITPTADAITGDYNVTMTATAAEATSDAIIRVKVETPAFWWIAGIVLIVAVFAGLYWVFRTYGRR
jgi:uncharacterized membrane protein